MDIGRYLQNKAILISKKSVIISFPLNHFCTLNFHQNIAIVKIQAKKKKTRKKRSTKGR